MNVFAGYGYDVWTMDHDGYGKFRRPGANSYFASGVEDLKAAVPVVMQETGQQKIHFFAPRPAAFAPPPMRRPRRSGSIV